jgi:hypothetical protein
MFTSNPLEYEIERLLMLFDLLPKYLALYRTTLTKIVSIYCRSIVFSCLWYCIMRSYWIHVVLVCARELPVVDWWFTNHNFLFFNQFDYLARWAIIICNNSIRIFFNPEWLVCWLRALFLFSLCIMRSYWIHAVLFCARELRVMLHYEILLDSCCLSLCKRVACRWLMVHKS